MPAAGSERLCGLLFHAAELWSATERRLAGVARVSTGAPLRQALGGATLLLCPGEVWIGHPAVRSEANRKPRGGAPLFRIQREEPFFDACGSSFIPSPYLVEPGVLIVPVSEPEVEAKAGRVVSSSRRSNVKPPVAP